MVKNYHLLNYWFWVIVNQTKGLFVQPFPLILKSSQINRSGKLTLKAGGRCLHPKPLALLSHSCVAYSFHTLAEASPSRAPPALTKGPQNGAEPSRAKHRSAFPASPLSPGRLQQQSQKSAESNFLSGLVLPLSKQLLLADCHLAPYEFPFTALF